MATMTKEQIEQKMQQLKQLAEEVSALTNELVEAGAIEIPEGELDKVAGGSLFSWWRLPPYPTQDPERMKPTLHPR